MIIKSATGQLWEKNLEGFELVESGNYTPEPNSQVIAQIKAEYEAAFERDLAETPDPEDGFALSYYVNRGAVEAKWGNTYQAMRAYELWRVACADGSDFLRQ